ncbi:hypothetical protein EYR36_007431 [Pleurotus pulmonarius]|nr:hypothetical protein EYR36_007431 [Pleurotus pulmonarius]
MSSWSSSSSLSSISAQMDPHLADTYVSIPLGIFIGLLASFIQSLGLTIQRKSHVLNQQLPEHEQRVEHRRPLWLLGFTIFISSNILGSLVQIASLPVVILAPLGAVSLLWNAFFARMLLGDVFSPWMILGTLLIAGGAVLIAVFGIVPEPTHSLEDLLALFRRPPFVAYFSTLGSVVFVALAVSHIVEYSLSRRTTSYDTPLVTTTPVVHASIPENPSTLTTGVTNTLSEAITTERTPLLTRKNRTLSSASSTNSSFLSGSNGASIQRTRLLLAISYASFSGILSGMCLIFAKSGVELLVLSLRGHFQFWRWESWILVLGLVVFALLQLWYLHKALVLADPTLVCPSAFCFYNISSIVNGLVYYDQFSMIPPLHLGLVGLGMAVLLSGVWVVSIQSSDDGAEDSEWSDGEVSSLSDVEAASSPRQPLSSTRVDDYVEESDVEDVDALAERLVKSESNIAEITPSLDHAADTHCLEVGRTPRPVSSQRQSGASTLLPPTSPPRPSSHARQSSDTIPLSLDTSNRSSRHRRRPTIDTYTGPFRNHGSNKHLTSPRHAKTLSHLSPAVSTLSGFQIGLSPVSPGFSIVPRERGARRISGLVTSLGAEESGHGRRRRTVSEGDFTRTVALLGEDEQRRGDLAESGGHVERGDGSSDVEGRAQESGTPDGGGKGKGKVGNRPTKGRWKWLKGVFSMRRD